ncbi:DedA family protein [Microbacterium sp. CFH 31415]|uniref:DedA family protein n=1 Tax=Microbacterium sp. CFH 31415 TaxID=2921732 RepID=UPI001F12A412|nr:DedA family protein [Microbacterium sp. CFH 31415]MCH6231055.1 DedA family protein [Microbacterium sp. CFH 31415]
MTETSSDSSWLSALLDWSVSLMDVIGPAGAGVAIALENLFPPLPSEVVLPMAGLAASTGSFTLFEALAWTTGGSIAGAFLLYGLGAWLGVDRLRRIAGRVPLLHPEDIDRTVAWFQRHGGKAVFFGRMIPIFRSLISIPAGVTRMPLWRFGLLTAAGSLIWNTIFVLSGYLLGESWHVVEQYVDVLQYVVIAVVAVAGAWFVFVRTRALVEASRDRRSAAQREDARELASSTSSRRD